MCSVKLSYNRDLFDEFGFVSGRVRGVGFVSGLVR